MVQSDTVTINVQDEILKPSSKPLATSPADQRLEKALNSIEDFLTEQNNQSNTQTDLKSKDVVLANLDILISRMQDILQQFDAIE